MTPRPTLVLIALAILVSTACGRDSGPVTPAPPNTPGAPAPPGPPAPPAPGPPPTSIQDEVTGDYDLTLDIGSGCSIVPETERTRRYTATITSPEQNHYLVTLTSGTFLQGAICTFHRAGTGCHQFEAERSGDVIRFDLANNNDDAHGGHIVEQFTDGTWAEIIGAAVGKRDGSSIDASGPGHVWYCRSASGYPFPCPSFSGCDSSELRLRFVRK